MVKIRLKRLGKRHNPFYRIVIADARAPRDGKFIEEVGTYDPNKKAVKLNNKRILAWLNEGAQPTQTVRDIFRKKGVMTKFVEAKRKAKAKAKKDA